MKISNENWDKKFGSQATFQNKSCCNVWWVSLVHLQHCSPSTQPFTKYSRSRYHCNYFALL